MRNPLLTVYHNQEDELWVDYYTGKLYTTAELDEYVKNGVINVVSPSGWIIADYGPYMDQINKAKNTPRLDCRTCAKRDHTSCGSCDYIPHPEYELWQTHKGV